VRREAGEPDVQAFQGRPVWLDLRDITHSSTSRKSGCRYAAQHQFEKPPPRDLRHGLQLYVPAPNPQIRPSHWDGSQLVDALRYTPDAARLKSASLGVSRQAV